MALANNDIRSHMAAMNEITVNTALNTRADVETWLTFHEVKEHGLYGDGDRLTLTLRDEKLSVMAKLRFS